MSVTSVYVPKKAMAKRRWWVCPNCGRRNWLDRQHHPTNECSRCGNSYIGRSYWPPKTREWILWRDKDECALKPFQKIVGACGGPNQVIHPKLRQHGGKMTDPRNGIVLCKRHADWLIYGRMGAREAYGEERESFDVWHNEFRYVPFAGLPIEIQRWRIFLAGLAWARTQLAKERAEASDRWRKKQRAKRASRG